MQDVSSCRNNFCGQFSVLSISLFGSASPTLLLPLTTFSKGPFQVASIPDFGLSDQNGPVLSRDFFVELSERKSAEDYNVQRTAILSTLRSSIPNVDVLDIHNIHPQIDGLPNPLFDVAGSTPDGTTNFLEDANLQNTKLEPVRSVYKETTTKFRKLRERGVELVLAETTEDCISICNTILQQRLEKLKSLSHETEDTHEFQDAFYRRLASSDASDNPFKAMALRFEQEIIAAVALMATGKSITGVLVSMGGDKWHRFSPGMVLVAKSIESARENGYRSFCFGIGNQTYKKRFGGAELNRQRLVWSLSLKGKAYLAGIRTKKMSGDLLRYWPGGIS